MSSGIVVIVESIIWWIAITQTPPVVAELLGSVRAVKDMLSSLLGQVKCGGPTVCIDPYMDLRNPLTRQLVNKNLNLNKRSTLLLE